MKIALLIPVYNEEEALPLFYEQLKETLGGQEREWEVIFVDERLSTVEAYTYMNAGDMKSGRRRSVIDAMSAQIILQSYLDSEKRKAEAGQTQKEKDAKSLLTNPKKEV